MKPSERIEEIFSKEKTGLPSVDLVTRVFAIIAYLDENHIVQADKMDHPVDANKMIPVSCPRCSETYMANENSTICGKPLKELLAMAMKPEIHWPEKRIIHASSAVYMPFEDIGYNKAIDACKRAVEESGR